MALSESALSELLDALTDRERGVDLVRELAQYLAQELIEVQATQAVGAARYERSDERVTERNGHCDRVLTTKAGDLELAIPTLRKGSFFPSILEPRRRIDQALYAVVMEAYVSGVSTRSVDALVESMGAASGIKKSEVSRICAGLDERVTAFRNRTLGHTEFPYVYLDAIYVHVRDDALGQVVSRRRGLRDQDRGARRTMARATRTGPRQLGSRTPPRCPARRPGHHRRERSAADRTVRDAHRRGHQPPRGSRRAPPTQHRPTALPGLRSRRCRRALHRTRASLGQPNRRHRCTETPGTASGEAHWRRDLSSAQSTGPADLRKCVYISIPERPISGRATSMVGRCGRSFQIASSTAS